MGCAPGHGLQTLIRILENTMNLFVSPWQPGTWLMPPASTSNFASICALGVAMCLGAVAQSALADEAVIRKTIPERIPALKQIDEVTKSPIPGLWELRYNGTEILYTDAAGNYILQGSLIDTKARRNLTEERIDKLTAIAFDALPAKDAFTIVRGNGKRKLAVFEDPNCGYCKRFERDLQKVDNVTISMYLYPILSADSGKKSEAVWCAADKAKAWQDFMVRDLPLPPVASPGCDSAALQRNLAFGKKHKITGTPTLVFADGSRVPGAITSAQVEKYLSEQKN
jgi:thiol:disulfide interchange protein DsbC